jgi:hypothetical protein
MTIIGYTDEENPRPVRRLTEEQEVLKARLKTLGQEIHDTRDVLQRLEIMRELARRNCKHEVFQDHKGYPYDARFCIICGTTLTAK